MMLRIDLKRWYWNTMVGRQCFGRTYMVVPMNYWRFVRAKIPAGWDEYLAEFRGKWLPNRHSVVQSFHKQRGRIE